MSHGATSRGPRSLPHWLRYWKPDSLIGIARDGTEHPIAVQHVKHRWAVVMRTLESIDAIGVRALDKKGAVIAATEIELHDSATNEPEEPEESTRATIATPTQPATSSGVDVAAIVNTVATAVTSSNIEVVKAVGATQETAFKELLSVVRLVSERLSALEQMWHERMIREEETSRDDKEGDALLKMIVEKAGPDMVRGFFGNAKTTNGASHGGTG